MFSFEILIFVFVFGRKWQPIFVFVSVSGRKWKFIFGTVFVFGRKRKTSFRSVFSLNVSEDLCTFVSVSAGNDTITDTEVDDFLMTACSCCRWPSISVCLSVGVRWMQAIQWYNGTLSVSVWVSGECRQYNGTIVCLSVGVRWMQAIQWYNGTLSVSVWVSGECRQYNGTMVLCLSQCICLLLLLVTLAHFIEQLYWATVWFAWHRAGVVPVISVWQHGSCNVQQLYVVHRLHRLVSIARVSAGSDAVHCVHSGPRSYSGEARCIFTRRRLRVKIQRASPL